MKPKLILASLAIIVIAGATYAAWYATHSDGTARASAATTPIPVGSTAVVAKRHAGQGVLPKCLAKNATTEAAVRADDYLIGKGPDTAFDLATTMGILDVPTGTNIDVSVNSYDGKVVTGSVKYPQKYGTYNFSIVPSSKPKPYQQWTMTSLIACT